MEGKPIAAADLWPELEARLREFARRRLPREEDVEDLLQDVLVRLHRGLDAITDTTRATAWVFRVATHAVADFYRDQAKRAVVTDEVEVPGPATGDAEARQAELGRCLEPFLERVPEPYREALRMVEFEGLTQESAARRAGISLSGMKSRVQRGRDRLRQLLTDCCRIEFDRRGRVVDFERRNPSDRPSCCGDTSCSDGSPTP